MNITASSFPPYIYGKLGSGRCPRVKRERDRFPEREKDFVFLLSLSWKLLLSLFIFRGRWEKKD